MQTRNKKYDTRTFRFLRVVPRTIKTNSLDRGLKGPPGVDEGDSGA
jgi:hypothetical protein